MPLYTNEMSVVMPNFLTLRDGRKVLLNTPEEEAQINAGIAADPDAYEMTDAELASLRHAGHQGDLSTLSCTPQVRK